MASVSSTSKPCAASRWTRSAGWSCAYAFHSRSWPSERKYPRSCSIAASALSAERREKMTVPELPTRSTWRTRCGSSSRRTSGGVAKKRSYWSYSANRSGTSGPGEEWLFNVADVDVLAVQANLAKLIQNGGGRGIDGTDVERNVRQRLEADAAWSSELL